jgi:hypothetical protein
MHLKVFLKLKNPKNTLFWVKKSQKNQKTPRNPIKNIKNKKKPLGWFFFKNPGFFQPFL